MDIVASLVVVLVGAAMVAWVVSPGTARGIDAFAAGFLPYRSAGWPQGVQEEDPIPWSWSAPRGPDATEGHSGAGLDPELVEITGPDAPVASRVHRGPMVHGTAGRRA